MAVFILVVTEVVDAFVVFVLVVREPMDVSVEAPVLAEAMVAVEIFPSLSVESETTMTFVDVIAVLSLGCESRVVEGGVVGMVLELFAIVIVLERTVAVAVAMVDGQAVILKPRFPVVFSHMVRFVRRERADSSGFKSDPRANSRLDAVGLLPFRGVAVPIGVPFRLLNVSIFWQKEGSFVCSESDFVIS